MPAVVSLYTKKYFRTCDVSVHEIVLCWNYSQYGFCSGVVKVYLRVEVRVVVFQALRPVNVL